MPQTTPSLPPGLFAPGRWAFVAFFEVHDGSGRMEGWGDGIGLAIARGFHENTDPSIDEAGSVSDWEVQDLSLDGNPFLATTRDAHAAALSAVIGFSAWDDPAGLAAAVRRLQAAEAERAHAAALAADLERMLAIRNGGVGDDVGESRHLVGTAEPNVPEFKDWSADIPEGL